MPSIRTLFEVKISESSANVWDETTNSTLSLSTWAFSCHINFTEQVVQRSKMGPADEYNDAIWTYTVIRVIEEY